jgi:hypothetical protein
MGDLDTELAGQHLVDAVAEVLVDGAPVDLGELAVEAHVAQLGVEEAESDRRVGEQRVEQGEPFVLATLGLACLPEPPCVVDREGAAGGELLGRGEIVVAVAAGGIG